MSDFPLNSAIAKAARADEHLTELQQELDQWMKSGPYTLRTTDRRFVFDYAAQVNIEVMTVEPVPSRVPTILGDFLSNLGAALDHVAWAAVCQNLGREPTETEGARSVYFPHRWKREDFDSDRTVMLVASEVGDRMRAYQPFSRTNKGAVKPLTTLRALHNTDKHRAVHAVVGSMLADPGPKIVAEGFAILDVIVGEPILLPGANLARVLIESESVEPEGSVGIHEIPVEIRFGEGEDVTFSDLGDIRRAVAQVIDDFAPLFCD